MSPKHHNLLHFAAATVFAFGLFAPNAALAQESGGQGGADRAQFAGMQRSVGEVTAISGNRITLKTEDAGTMDIVTTENTRVMKGRGVSLKVADIKPGDGVTAAGNLDAPNKTLHAAIVFVVDAAQVKQMKDNLGKTYIAGKVTAIDLDDARMTVERPDHVAQTIGFDDTTSFRRGGRVNMGAYGGGGATAGFGSAGSGRGDGSNAGNGGTPPAPTGGESITLADIKVGDTVGGQGSLKAGVFVPTLLTVANPGGPGRHRGAGNPNNATNPGGTSSTPPATSAGTPPPSLF